MVWVPESLTGDLVSLSGVPSRLTAGVSVNLIWVPGSLTWIPDNLTGVSGSSTRMPGSLAKASGNPTGFTGSLTWVPGSLAEVLGLCSEVNVCSSCVCTVGSCKISCCPTGACLAEVSGSLIWVSVSLVPENWTGVPDTLA